MAIIYPPGPYHFAIDLNYITFTDGGEVAALTNFCVCSTQFNVPVWRMTVVETQMTTRVWLYEGTGSASFRTNQYPASYDPQQWVLDAFSHDAPGDLTGDDLAQWYADRDRSRFSLTMTFVNLNDWPTLLDAQWTTNSPPPGIWTPTIPADTNNMKFLRVQTSPDTIGLWIYTPASRPVTILACSALSYTKNVWTVLGGFNAVPPFQFWQTARNSATDFFIAGYTDVDSDGEGIPDFLESYVYGTDPTKKDSDNDGVSDYDEIFIYGTDPLNPDITPPVAVITSPPNNYNLVWVP